MNKKLISMALGLMVVAGLGLFLLQQKSRLALSITIPQEVRKMVQKSDNQIKKATTTDQELVADEQSLDQDLADLEAELDAMAAELTSELVEPEVDLDL